MSLATRGSTGMKIIVFMGMGTFLFLMLVMFGLRQSFKPQENLRVKPGASQSPFDASRAWRDLEHVVGLGPRPSGSGAMGRQQSYIRRELRNAGLGVRNIAFAAETPNGAIDMVNLIGVVEGTRPGVIALSGHYDTKKLPGIEFVGANDAGSSTAWLLEMARTLGPQRDGRTIWLIFFDGEEAQASWSSTDGLYGSRRLVEALRESGELASIACLIDIAMIGDCYLSVFKDPGAPAWLSEIVWNTARRYGYGRHFGQLTTDIEGDHIPFRAAGVPALRLIDFSYGGSRLDHGRYWHTAEDTLEKVCPESLRAVGDVIYHALPVIEGQLDTMGARGDGY